ncbi:hypothetical protein TRVL_01980 [Trypanosoma vivax]|nr:hypothetical protein TRVL_01980 [Trypanosoma vivax]
MRKNLSFCSFNNPTPVLYKSSLSCLCMSFIPNLPPRSSTVTCIAKRLDKVCKQTGIRLKKGLNILLSLMSHHRADALPYRPCWSLEKRWFLQFFVSILLCLNNGACFCFGVFSPFMKAPPFEYNQSQLSLVSTVGVLLSYFSLPTGFLYDNRGPALTIAVGTLLNLSGLFGLLIMFYDRDQPLLGTSVWLMTFFYSISQFSASFYETGSILTSLEAFKCYQGRVILIQKTFMGLGSALIVQIYLSFFEHSASGIWPFFLFLLFYSFIVGVLGTLLIRLPTAKTHCLGLTTADDGVVRSGGGESALFKLPFNVGTGLLLLTIFFVSTATLVEDYHPLTVNERYIVGVLTILLCMSFSIMIVVTPSYSSNVGGYASESVLLEHESQSTLGEAPPRLADEDTRASHSTNVPPHAGDGVGAWITRETVTRLENKSGHNDELWSLCEGGSDMNRAGAPGVYGTRCTSRQQAEGRSRATSFNGRCYSSVEPAICTENQALNSDSLWQNIRRLEMWLMWFVCFASWSSATLVSTNSSQLYKALDFNDYSPRVNAVYVSMYGVASALGRVVVGFTYPVVVQQGIPISLFLCIAPILNFFGLLLFLILSAKALIIPFILVGLATGFVWGGVVLVIKSLFTPQNCGKHYGVLYTAGMLSPLVFNVALFGPIYDYYSKKQGRYAERECEGRVCVWIPLAVCAAFNFIALPAALHLTLRTWRWSSFPRCGSA